MVGPRSDPAHIAGTRDAVAALQAIAGTKAPFVSRGDNSGTDALEHRLWRVAGIDPATAGGRSWYRDIGGGMGAALNAAQAMDAFTISDRGTWLSFAKKGDLAVLVEGDPRLLNRYDVILLNPAKHPAQTGFGQTTMALGAIAPLRSLPEPIRRISGIESGSSGTPPLFGCWHTSAIGGAFLL